MYDTPMINAVARVVEAVVNTTIRLLFALLCKLDTSVFEQIPGKGPLVLVTNHSGNLEGPMLYVFMRPRTRVLSALGKRELWSSPLKFFMQLWGIIPLRRGGVDRKALARAGRLLDQGGVLGIAPEGTRSKTGTLAKAHAGAAMIAVQHGAPVIPVAQWGLLDVLRYWKRFKRCPIRVRVGRLCKPVATGEVDSAELRAIADELMTEVASMLPARMRGVYADLVDQPRIHIRYVD